MSDCSILIMDSVLRQTTRSRLMPFQNSLLNAERLRMQTQTSRTAQKVRNSRSQFQDRSFHFCPWGMFHIYEVRGARRK